MKPQPFSVGVFSCPIAPVSACCCGFPRKPADFASRPNRPFRATFHSLLTIPRSDLAPWNWPEVRKGHKSALYRSKSYARKRIRVGKMEIRLQHVCQRKLALAGRPAGLALAAMWYLGKKEVTPALVEKIRRKLGSSEFEVLKSATSSMPAWMSDAIFRNERTAVHA